MAANLSTDESAALAYLGRFGARAEVSLNAVSEDCKIDEHRVLGVLRGLEARKLVWRRSTACWAISAAGNRLLGMVR